MIKKTRITKHQSICLPKDYEPSANDLADAKDRAKKILAGLKKAHPDAKCALVHCDALELLIATILSAQCTDERVNIVSKDLFKKYRGAADFAKAELKELEDAIRSTGFFRNKAKNIQSACRDIQEKFNGEVPRTMDELLTLAGVGRKTANVVLGNVFDVPGIVTDTHVIRLSRLMGLSANQDPVKLEFDLMLLIPKKDWALFSHLMAFHGRRVCIARNPLCDKCTIRDHCCYGRLTKGRA